MALTRIWLLVYEYFTAFARIFTRASTRLPSSPSNVLRLSLIVVTMVISFLTAWGSMLSIAFVIIASAEMVVKLS
jgi:hypothetical protein